MKTFFSNQTTITIIGTIASIIVSVIVAIYFYKKSIVEPELMYLVNPSKVIIYKSGISSNLIVFPDVEKYLDSNISDVKLDSLQQIKNDIHAVQIGIWNHGKKPIQQTDIIQKINIISEPRVKFLDSIITHKKRNVIGCELDKSNLNDGIVGLNWKILEKTDGFLVQIIYEGKENVDFLIDGIIIGQSSIETKIYDEINDRKEGLNFMGLIIFIPLFFFVLIPLFCAVIAYEIAKKSEDSLYRNKTFLYIFKDYRDTMLKTKRLVFLYVLISGCIGVYLLFLKQPPQPPFGF